MSQSDASNLESDATEVDVVEVDVVEVDDMDEDTLDTGSDGDVGSDPGIEPGQDMDQADVAPDTPDAEEAPDLPTCTPEPERCDGIDNDCDATIDEGCDDDSDGFCDAQMAWEDSPEARLTCPNGPGDCEDTNAATSPGAAEICDGVDNNCDSGGDEGCDDDADGFCDAALVFLANPSTAALCPHGSGDCDDDDAAIHPSADETCDGIDNNCDGDLDEGCDDDSDGFCDALIPWTDSPEARATCPNGGGDCDDQDPQRAAGLAERCDGQDNSCDALIDEGCDDDSDGFCDAALEFIDSPEARATCPNGGGDCADDHAQTYPGALELCDGLDNDCDGVLDQEDEDYQTLCLQQYGVCEGTLQACQEGQLQICGPRDYQRHASQQGLPYQLDPTFGETLCDGFDNDCDGVIDEHCCGSDSAALVEAWDYEPAFTWTSIKDVQVASTPDGSTYATLSVLYNDMGEPHPVLTLRDAQGSLIAHIEHWPASISPDSNFSLLGGTDHFRVIAVSERFQGWHDISLQGQWNPNGSVLITGPQATSRLNTEMPILSRRGDSGEIYLAQHTSWSDRPFKHRVWQVNVAGNITSTQQWEYQGDKITSIDLLWHQGWIYLASITLEANEEFIGTLYQVSSLQINGGLQPPHTVLAAQGPWDTDWDTRFRGHAIAVQGEQLLHYALLQEDQDSPGTLHETRLALDTLTTLQPSTELQTVTSTIGEFLDASVQADGSIQLFWLGDDLGDDRFSLYQWAPGQAQPRKLAPDLYEGHVYASLPQGSGSNLWFAASNDRYDPPRLIRLALDPTGAPLCLYDNED